MTGIREKKDVLRLEALGGCLGKKPRGGLELTADEACGLQRLRHTPHERHLREGGGRRCQAHERVTERVRWSLQRYVEVIKAYSYNSIGI
jgi:hypothetical protein